jgi:putative sigma-54 modulation protein
MRQCRSQNLEQEKLMILITHRHHTEWNEELHEHLNRRFDASMSRFHDRIRTITVRFQDVNGPRGGKDKLIRVLVKLAPHGELVLDDMDSDMYALISRAAERVGRRVARHLGRRRTDKQQFGRNAHYN